MRLYKTHLSFNDEEIEQLNSNDKISTWLEKVKISPQSYYKDDVWILEGSDSYRKDLLIINWDKNLIEDKTIKDFPNLYDTVKRCLFFMQTTLESERIRKPLTQTNVYIYFHFIIKWMVQNNIKKFEDISEKNFESYYNYVSNKKTIKGTLIKDKRGYVYPFYLLNCYKNYLNDTVAVDFFKGQSLNSFLEYNQDSREQTKSINKTTLEALLNHILPIIDEIEKEALSLEEIHQKHFKNIKNHNKFCTHLNAIAYSIIALYTGMRVTEILSIIKGSTKVIENTVFIKGLLFKTTTSKKGIEETWACGLNNDKNYAFKIIKILERLSPLTHQKLFFSYHNNFTSLRTSSINKMLNNMLSYYGIEDRIATHQFRRTFAKLIGITDKTNLLALQQHFKHVSIAMTNYYVGNDNELIEMISDEKKLEIMYGLEQIIQSSSLAGKLGEKIVNSNIRFRGKAGEQLRKDYIDTLINESDLIVMPHEYGFCIYQPEQARCKGEQKNIGLNTCVKCSNFVVSQEHKVFWHKRVDEYQRFSTEIAHLSNQVETTKELQYCIEEANQIIKKIEG